MPDKSMLEIVFIVCSVIGVMLLYLIVRQIIKIIKKEKVFKKRRIPLVAAFVAAAVCVAGIEFVLFNLPNLLLGGTPWAAIDEYGPTGFINTVIAIGLLFLVVFLYCALRFCFSNIASIHKKTEG